MSNLQDLLNTGNYFTDKGNFIGSEKYFDGDINGEQNLHNYIDIYEKIFSKYKEEKINLLEIGILNGGSIKLWRDYFTKANIHGIDIVYTDKAKNTLKNLNISIDLCDSTDSNSHVLKNIIDNSYDIIIDDGNHSFEFQYKTLLNFFPKLKKDGIYIIEDIEDRTMNNIRMINTFKSFKEFDIIDLRKQDKRKDSVLFIFKK